MYFRFKINISKLAHANFVLLLYNIGNGNKGDTVNTNLISKSCRDAIVDDILLRKPKGDGVTKPEFVEDTYWCYDARKNKNRVTCKHEGWGYTDEKLWDLGFRSESDIRDYIFSRFYSSDEITHSCYLTSGKRAGVTRKTNRIYERINSALRRVVSSGDLTGIYKVSVGWRVEFYFHGDSVSEIKTLSETMLRPIFQDETFTVSFVEKSDPGEMLDRNIKSIEKIRSNATRLREKAEENLNLAKQAESQIEYVQTLITQNLEVAMRAS